MQQLGQLAVEGFVATMGEGIELYHIVCPLPKRLQHLYSCRPFELVHVQRPGNARQHCQLCWMVHGAMRHHAPIARLEERAAPANLQASAY